jgi:hypothetical protein
LICYSQQASAGFQASLCVPPFCYGQTVSGSAIASDQTITDNFQSANQQSGISAGSGRLPSKQAIPKAWRRRKQIATQRHSNSRC